MSEASATPKNETPWREMSDSKLAISNLTFKIEKLSGEINMKNPFDSTSVRPNSPTDITSRADVSDFQNAVTEHRQDKFEAAQFDEGNEDRVRGLRLTLDALEDDKRIVEIGGKNQEELIDKYAAAERERMEQLEKSKKDSI